jgi:hypothetical protein
MNGPQFVDGAIVSAADTLSTNEREEREIPDFERGYEN